MTANEDSNISVTNNEQEATTAVAAATTTTTTTATTAAAATTDIKDPHETPPDYQSSRRIENEPDDIEDETITTENGELTFPLEDLLKLEEQVNRMRWIVPVLADGELIKCLRASVRLARQKIDLNSESCQRFIRDSLVTSFTKILCDEAVMGWKNDIYTAIYKNAMIFIQLCVLKMDEDCFPLLDVLSFVMNPSGRFHQANNNRTCLYRLPNEVEPFAMTMEYRFPQKGWLVDFINKFGQLGGFDKILNRFTSSETKLTISIVITLLKPWGLCYEFLTPATVEKYFSRIIELVPQYLNQLTENDFKAEAKTESKSDTLSAVIKWLRNLACRLPDNDKACRDLDELRLKMILRLLQTNSFSGKMHALNEVHKLLPSLSPIHRSTLYRSDDNEGLTPEKFIQWIQEHEILDIVLRDCLHQPQYVEKLERVLRFMIKEQALSRNDLAKIWNASSGKHEAIEKNVHDLLAKLAWDFSPEQLEQLFDCFRESWTKASKKQREKLLELIRKLAEDDKEGLMANKVLELLWNISHEKNFPNEIIDQALAAHLKILDYSCLMEKEKTKLSWIERMMEEVKQDQHVIISLKQMREICTQFSEHPYMHTMARMNYPLNRIRLIDLLEQTHNFTRVITENLCKYMENTRKHLEETKKILPAEDYYPDGRFNHNQQINERLVFLKFMLKEGRINLCYDYTKMIWVTLAEQAIYPHDREQCFRWFAEIIDEVGFDFKTGKDFFQNHLMKLEPHLLTDHGMNCFDRFFKSVNAQLNKFLPKRRSMRLINDKDLVGIEYLWRLILNGSDPVANRGIQLIKEVYTNISPSLKNDIKRIHQTFMTECFKRLRGVYDTMKSKTNQATHQNRIISLTRILIVLREYISECDYSYRKDRSSLPISRAFRGRPLVLIVRINTGQNRQIDDLEHPTHSNETWGHIRKMIFNRYKGNYGILELYRANELIYPEDDNKSLAQTDGRDRIIISARWVQQATRNVSSDESSSSESEINNNFTSSSPSPSSSTVHQTRVLEPIDQNAESALPSMIFAQEHENYQFLIELSDMGCKENNIRLRDTARQILDLVPVDSHSYSNLMNCFLMKANLNEITNRLKSFYFPLSPTQMLYNLKTTLVTLVPVIVTNESSELESIYVRFLNAGGLTNLLNILTDKKIIEQCDMKTRKSIYLTIFYMLKRILIILGFYQLKLSNSSIYNESLDQLYSSMSTTILPIGEHPTTVLLENRIALFLAKHIHDYPLPKSSHLQYNHIIDFIRLIWCLASHNKKMSFDVNITKDFNEIHQTFKIDNVNANDQDYLNDYSEEDTESQLACREILELLCISIVLVPTSVEKLLKEKFFEYFLIDMTLYCRYSSLRHTASEQIYLLTTRCSQGQSEHLLKYLIDKQFQIFNTNSDNLQMYSSCSLEFFSLLCRLLSFAYLSQILPSNIEQQLHDEIIWLKNIQLPIDDYLLRGHLNLAKELLQFQSNEQKRFYGIEQLLIQQIIEQFLFPASTLLYQLRLNKEAFVAKQAIDNDDNQLKEPSNPICQTPTTISAAFDLLVVLGTNCIDNLKLIDKYITDLFYSAPDSNLHEWDFSLPVGSRPTDGFVGLKNASATCYMNSVLQQLFMIRPLRTALLSVKIPSEYADDEQDEDDLRKDSYDPYSDAKSNPKDNKTSVSPGKDVTTDRNEYNIQILRQIQRIFGYLLESKLQFYIPRGFWKIIKLGGEPVNLRDQQDAVEFLNTVVDSVDEALKKLNLPQICSQVLGGKFADQKICKDCPHRYSREEDFTLISVDIRHSQNLKESLEQYVIGELLDGPNAYHCEKCNKKVDTIKRTCFKKLPAILAIQLKRFDYDWERETPIKFNDYFEFPRELDMEPFTVQGLAKAEGTIITEENTTENQTSTDLNNNDGTRYRLVGIIVHMGQANGGHYYSFIQNKNETDPMHCSRWYKFDDTDVSECKMDDDEELRSQCFGGDNPASSFDQPAMKRQRRWWNAYILFYEKISTDSSDTTDSVMKQLQLYDPTQRMPLSVQRSVRKQNIKFLHNRLLFSSEYFAFVKKLVQNNVQYVMTAFALIQTDNTEVITDNIEQLALICIQIATKFLFSIGWHTKKALRGQTNEWTEVISNCLRVSRRARQYLANELLFKHPHRFQEYLIDCTSADVRNAFGRVLVTLARTSRIDDEERIDKSQNQEDQLDQLDQIIVEETIILNVVQLLKKEFLDNVKTLAQYFNFFIIYCAHGRYECEKLIRLNIPSTFAHMAYDDVTTSSMSRFIEISKLSLLLSTLIRCFDVSVACKANKPNNEILPNPYQLHDSGPICPIPEDLIQIVYKQENFLRKLIEDCVSGEELHILLRFIIWENPNITHIILPEILGSLSKLYTTELRTSLEITNLMLTVKDSWQEARILYVLNGIPLFIEKPIKNDKSVPSTRPQTSTSQNLFEICAKLESSSTKRAYQIVKAIYLLFSKCEKALYLLQNDQDIKRQWIHSVRWLRVELGPNPTSANNYYPPLDQTISNDTSPGFYLERTRSAQSLLEKAWDLCSEKDYDEVGSNSDDFDEN